MADLEEAVFEAWNSDNDALMKDLIAAALASQAESHATELGRLKAEHRAELEKAWDDGAHLGYVDGYEDASRRDPVGTTVTPNPHRKQSKETT